LTATAWWPKFLGKVVACGGTGGPSPWLMSTACIEFLRSSLSCGDLDTGGENVEVGAKVEGGDGMMGTVGEGTAKPCGGGGCR